jgi:hypothetical protein
MLQLNLLNRGKSRLEPRKLPPEDTELLEEALKADYASASIRLRNGEHQYGLARAIAFFMLELRFPDVKDIISSLYGENRAEDIQFVRKIQTVLKKMQKNGIVKILPKTRPWELQRYALSSFKFSDSDKNSVSFATDAQIEQAQSMLRSLSARQQVPRIDYGRLSILVVIAGASYALGLWSLVQSVIVPAIFLPSLSVSVISSLMLGKTLSGE